MLHSRFSRLATVLLASATIFSSCQKDLDVQSADIDKLRIRGANGGNLSSLAAVGRQIFFDSKMSNPVGSQSCASCHMPNVGFAGIGDGVGFVQGIGQGAVQGAFGGRKPPSAAYASFAPQLTLDTPPADPADPVAPVPEFTGGLFWDGRATGLRLGNPAAEQALGPFLSPAEHNIDKLTVLNNIKSSNYYSLWLSAFNNEPIDLSNSALIEANYDKVGRAIAAYEATAEVNKFTSKYDASVKGKVRLSPQEERGLAIFNLQGECYDCHESIPLNATTPALFTDFSYHNLGLPKNTASPNKESLLKRDLGLGGELETTLPNGQFKYPAEWRAQAVAQYGKFKTPTLRNVAAGTNRRYMHNGIFNSLEAVVHFYNTRDVPGAGWEINGVFRTWAELGKEVNLNVEIHGAGNLGLTAAQEADLVAFMKTLTDGWSAPAGNTTVL
jgi:cytochrome c peroxidase